MTIPESIQALVATGPYAHLTTLAADGSPQVSIVWVGIESDEFVMGHMGEWTKVNPDVVFPPEPYRSSPGFITRITPSRYAGVGPWAPGQH